METLVCATKTGAEILGRDNEDRHARTRQIADVLVVEATCSRIFDPRGSHEVHRRGAGRVVKAGKLQACVTAAGRWHS